MGISGKDLKILIWMKRNDLLPNPFNSVIEIGAQQLANSFLEEKEDLQTIAHLFNVAKPSSFGESLPTHFASGVLEHQDENAPFAKDFWNWLGLSYASIDIDGSEHSIPIDLNFDNIPCDHKGKYELTTNFGTTEHVINQFNAFKIIHDLTSVGGLMMHHLPAQGMINHGFINYNPKFFWMLSRSNGYKWIYSDYTGTDAHYELPQNVVDMVALSDPTIHERKKKIQVSDCGLVVIMRKEFDFRFVAPIDVETGAKAANKRMEQRYWTVFSKNAFEQLEPQDFSQAASLEADQE